MEHGYTISKLAEVLGVTEQAVCKWQSGQSAPSIDHCIALCGLFQVSLDELIAVNQPVKKKDLFVLEDERSSFFALNRRLMDVNKETGILILENSK